MAKDAPKGKAWVIAVSMGYGHQRTAFPLRDLSPDGKVINANDYEGIPTDDREIWSSTSHFYEFISRFKRVPLVGSAVFYLYDRFQRILNFYPKRDLSRPTGTLRQEYRLIRRGWGRDIIERLSKGKIPLITTFFTTAFMAEEWRYPGDIYCVTADADVARSWAPLNPEKTRIHYCASTDRVFERLKLYGIKEGNIHLTGYPLPKENIGGPGMKTLRKDMGPRLVNLDPRGRYASEYGPVIKENFGALPKEAGRPLTLMFSIGGAGAQKEIGIAIVKSLQDDIRAKKVKVVLSAGTHRTAMNYFADELKKLGFREPFDDGAEILWAIGIPDYFEKFNKMLRVTDILWTKPSELSFYCGLGLPIIIAPPIGSQEDFNREWLFKVGAGMDQYDPEYTHEWLFDYLKDGWFAEAAMHGFLEAEKMGAYNIEKLIEKKKG